MKVPTMDDFSMTRLPANALEDTAASAMVTLPGTPGNEFARGELRLQYVAIQFRRSPMSQPIRFLTATLAAALLPLALASPAATAQDAQSAEGHRAVAEGRLRDESRCRV